MFSNLGYSFEVDLWAIGIIMYEMLSYEHPFVENHVGDVKEIIYHISTKEVVFPKALFNSTKSGLLTHAKSLIEQLLDKKCPKNRLGGSFSSLKAHPFFEGF